MLMPVDSIARVCHEANRALCRAIGDYSHESWEHAPQWQRDTSIKGVEAALDSMLAGEPWNPEQAHAAWMKQKLAERWTFGPIKDAEKKQHPALVPYSHLPAIYKTKDKLFVAICAALS
jgi:hypothetical protein